MDKMTRRYMTQAVGWANSSNYNNTHVGAVVVQGERAAGGCNNRLTDTCHIHAEVSALTAAAQAGIRTQGAKMYCTWAACPACAAAIVNAGIDEVYVLEAALKQTNEKWLEDVRTGLDILKAGDVNLIEISDELDTILRMNGEWFKV